MVTYFNKKDLANFGNYILSKERAQRILDATDVFENDWDTSLQERSKLVSHADVENFLESIKKVE